MIQFDKKVVTHYIMIYFLLILNQSCMYEYFGGNLGIRVALLGIVVLLILLQQDAEHDKYLFITGILLACTVLTRLITHGGVGLGIWVSWALPLLWGAYVVLYDIEHFMERFIKTAVFLAIIGVVFFLIQVLAPNLLIRLLPIQYNTGFSDKIWYDSINYEEIFHPGYGVFLYSYKAGGDSLLRNKGIFTEPGICQMLYNTAVFMLLFFQERISLGNKQIKKYLLILIFAIVTVQSTTGYIILSINLIVYLLTATEYKNHIKGFLIAFGICGLLLLGFDYFLRKDQSFLFISIIQKFFGSHDGIQLNGSGLSRIAVSVLALSMIPKHPLGMGADAFLDAVSLLDFRGGAGILQFGAISGVIPLLICILFYFIPIIKSDLKIFAKISLLYMIFASLLAQSHPFYPILIIIPIWLNEYAKGTVLEKRCLHEQTNCV